MLNWVHGILVWFLAVVVFQRIVALSVSQFHYLQPGDLWISQARGEERLRLPS